MTAPTPAFYYCQRVNGVVDSEACRECWDKTQKKHMVAMTRAECQKIWTKKIESVKEKA